MILGARKGFTCFPKRKRARFSRALPALFFVVLSTPSNQCRAQRSPLPNLPAVLALKIVVIRHIFLTCHGATFPPAFGRRPVWRARCWASTRVFGMWRNAQRRGRKTAVFSPVGGFYSPRGTLWGNALAGHGAGLCARYACFRVLLACTNVNPILSLRARILRCWSLKLRYVLSLRSLAQLVNLEF